MAGQRTSSDLPKGWTYEHIKASRDPRQHGAQVHEARRVFADGAYAGLRGEVVVQAPTVDELVGRAEEFDKVVDVGARARDFIVLPRRELQRLLDDNGHMTGQVKELQGALTLKEEQLRAHRRVPLTEQQRELLLPDLEATTRRVRDGYNLPTAEGLSDRLMADLDQKTRPILDDLDMK